MIRDVVADLAQAVALSWVSRCPAARTIACHVAGGVAARTRMRSAILAALGRVVASSGLHGRATTSSAEVLAVLPIAAAKPVAIVAQTA